MLQTYIHTLHTCTHIHTYIHVTNIHIHTYIHIHIYIHTYLHIHIHKYIHTHTYMYMYIHTYINTCTEQFRSGGGGGLRSLARIFSLLPSPKIKWLCSKITCFLPENGYLQIVTGGGGGGLAHAWPRTIAYFSRLWTAAYSVLAFKCSLGRMICYYTKPPPPHISIRGGGGGLHKEQELSVGLQPPP